MTAETNDISSFLSQKGYDPVPIQENAAGLLIIKASVNGEEGLFILDTGAGISVIDSRHAGRLGLALQNDNVSYTGAGAGGQGLEVIPATGNKVEIGNHTVNDFTLSVMSFENISQALTAAGCEDFAGVIGVDILKPGKAIIDYSNMMLYLFSDKMGDSI